MIRPVRRKAKIRETGSNHMNGQRVQVNKADGLYPSQIDPWTTRGSRTQSNRFISRNPGAWGNGIGIAVIDAGADYQVTVGSKSAHNIEKVIAAGRIITKQDDANYTGDPDARIKKDILTPGQQIGEYVVLEIDPSNTSAGSFAAVRLASAADQGTIPLKGEQFVDGILAVSGDRVLVSQQQNPTQNGVYLVRGFDPSGRPVDWLRADDADRSGNFTTGKRVLVKEGDTNQGKVYEYIGSSDPVLDDL